MFRFFGAHFNLGLLLSDLVFERIDLELKRFSLLFLFLHRGAWLLLVVAELCLCVLNLNRSLGSTHDLLGCSGCTHFLLLLQELEPGQVIVQLTKPLVFVRFFLDTLLVPSLNNSILGFIVIHESVLNLRAFFCRSFPQSSHSKSDLASLVLGKKEDFVGPLDEDFFPWPNP